MLDFWMLVFWILVDICTPVTAFPCTVGARVRRHHHLYMHYIYTCALSKPGFCTGGKPNNSALLSTSTHKNDDSKSLVIVHCWVPVLLATMITKVLVPVWID